MISLEVVASLCAIVAYIITVYWLLTTGSSMNVVSWLNWALLDGVAFVAAFFTGDRTPWMIGTFTAGAIVVGGLSVRNGSWEWGWLEKACTAAVLVALSFWLLNPEWTLVASSLAVGIAGIPQLVDANRDPASMDRWVWGLFLASNSLSLAGANFALLGEWFYPFIGTVYNLTMMFILLRPRHA